MRTITRNGESVTVASPTEILRTLFPITKQIEKYKDDLIQFERRSSDIECDSFSNPQNAEVNDFGKALLESGFPEKFPIEHLFGISTRIIWTLEAVHNCDPSFEILLVSKDARCFHSVLEFALFGLTPGADWKNIVLYSLGDLDKLFADY